MRERWRGIRRRRAREHSFSEPELPSADADVFFQGRFILCWQLLTSSTPHHDPDALLRTHVRSVVEAECSSEPVTRALVVQDRLNARFGMPWDSPESDLRLLWARADISADADDIATVRERRQVQAQAARRAEEQRQQIEYVDAFRTRILSDPGMALSYWFMKQSGDVPQDSFVRVEELSKKVASYDPERAWVQIAEVVQEFIRNLGPEERKGSIDALRWWFRRYDGHEYSDKLQSLEQASGGAQPEP